MTPTELPGQYPTETRIQGEKKSLSEQIVRVIDKLTSRIFWCRIAEKICFGSLAVEFAIEQQMSQIEIRHLVEIKSCFERGLSHTEDQVTRLKKHKITL